MAIKARNKRMLMKLPHDRIYNNYFFAYKYVNNNDAKPVPEKPNEVIAL